MNKLFAVLISFFMIVQPVLAVAPLGVSGTSDTSNQYPPVVKVPHKQATPIVGGTRLETGNSNLLQNPSFEHTTYSTGWTTSGGTPVEETTVVADGKKAMVFVASGTVSIYQDSSINVGGFFYGGVQGLATIRILTSVQGLYVCPRKAGSSITSNYASQCYAVKGTGAWELAKIPFTLGSSSNGIEIKSTGSVSGNIYLDDGFMGPVDLKVDGTSITQEEYTAACSGTGTAGDVLSCTPITNTLSSLMNAPTIVSGNIQITAKTDSILTIFAGRQDTNNLSAIAITKNGTTITTVQSVVTSNAVAVGGGTAQIRVATNDTIVVNYTGQSSVSAYVGFSAVRYAPSSTYSSTNADTGWTDGGTITISSSSTTPTKGTTALDKVWWKRSGDSMEIRFEYSQSAAGTAGTGQYLFTIPGGYEIDTTKISSTLIASGNSTVPSLASGLGFFGGRVSDNSTFTDHYSGFFVPYNATKLGVYSQYQREATTANGAGLLGPAGVGSLVYAAVNFTGYVKIPIKGWDNSNIIIGQFNGLESCADSYQCTDTYTADFNMGANTITTQTLSYITSCTGMSSGTAVCTFKSGLFTVPPTMGCSVRNVDAAATLSCAVTSISATGFTVVTKYQTTSASIGVNAYTVSIWTQKQGADYIGKTAKAVASDQNNRTVGVTSVETFAVSYGTGSATVVCSASPCSYLDQIGSAVSSITRSAQGSYVMNLAKTYSKLKCSLTAVSSQPNGGATLTGGQCSSCSTMGFSIGLQGTSAYDSYGTLTCIGVP